MNVFVFLNILSELCVECEVVNITSYGAKR